MIDKCSVVTADDKDYTLLISELVARIVSMELSSEYALTKQED